MRAVLHARQLMLFELFLVHSSIDGVAKIDAQDIARKVSQE
jgi:hypothetical protein